MRRRPVGYSLRGTAQRESNPPSKSQAGCPTLPPVIVRCRFCRQKNGPLVMDGKSYICKACRQPLFAYRGPTFDELMERVMAVQNPDRETLDRLEALARGDLTQLEMLATSEAHR